MVICALISQPERCNRQGRPCQQSLVDYLNPKEGVPEAGRLTPRGQLNSAYQTINVSFQIPQRGSGGGAGGTPVRALRWPQRAENGHDQ
jgi:hypothetical protein